MSWPTGFTIDGSRAWAGVDREPRTREGKDTMRRNRTPSAGLTRLLVIAGLLSGLVHPASAAAQPLYKCADASGRITYASEACERQGLKEVGPVRDRTTVVPGSPAAKAGAQEARPAEKKGGEPDAPGRAATVKPVNPLIEKVLR